MLNGDYMERSGNNFMLNSGNIDSNNMNNDNCIQMDDMYYGGFDGCSEFLGNHNINNMGGIPGKSPYFGHMLQNHNNNENNSNHNLNHSLFNVGSGSGNGGNGGSHSFNHEIQSHNHSHSHGNLFGTDVSVNSNYNRYDERGLQQSFGNRSMQHTTLRTGTGTGMTTTAVTPSIPPPPCLHSQMNNHHFSDIFNNHNHMIVNNHSHHSNINNNHNNSNNGNNNNNIASFLGNESMHKSDDTFPGLNLPPTEEFGNVIAGNRSQSNCFINSGNGNDSDLNNNQGFNFDPSFDALCAMPFNHE